MFLDGDPAPTKIAAVETGGRALVLQLDGVDSREAAESLVGRYVESAHRPLPAGTWYWDDLIGLSVVEPDGTAVGELVEVFRAGGGEVYRIVGDRGERLVPALRATVLEIDLDGRRMVVAPDDAEEVR